MLGPLTLFTVSSDGNNGVKTNCVTNSLIFSVMGNLSNYYFHFHNAVTVTAVVT